MGDEDVTAVVVSGGEEVDVPDADALVDPGEAVVGSEEGAVEGEGGEEEEEEGDPRVVV